MRALVYTAPHRMELRDLAIPEPGQGEVLLKVEAAGICGSDMHAYHGHDERRPAPLVLGHEAAGVIAAGPRAGEPVVINPLVTCGTCPACRSGRQHLCPERQIISMPPRPGAFAEFVKIPERNVIALPDGADFAKAALAEPVAVAWHAVRIANARLEGAALPAASALVLGAGAIGLASALVLSLFGVREIWISEPNPLRRETARRSGPFRVYDPLAEAGAEPGGITVVIDAVGAADTRAAASRLVAPGGIIVHVGLLPDAAGLDIRRITLQEITLVGSYCYSPMDFEEALAALMAARFGDLRWVEQRALGEGPQAFRAIDDGTTEAAKIVLRP